MIGLSSLETGKEAREKLCFTTPLSNEEAVIGAPNVAWQRGAGTNPVEGEASDAAGNHDTGM